MNLQTIRTVSDIADKLLQANFSENSFHIYVNEDTDEIAISVKNIDELGLLCKAEAILGAGLGLMITEWPTGWHVDVAPEPGVNFYTFGHFPTDHTSGDAQVDIYNRAIVQAVASLKQQQAEHQVLKLKIADFFLSVPMEAIS